MKMANV